jgi:hypothetical protein
VDCTKGRRRSGDREGNAATAKDMGARCLVIERSEIGSHRNG